MEKLPLLLNEEEVGFIYESMLMESRLHLRAVKNAPPEQQGPRPTSAQMVDTAHYHTSQAIHHAQQIRSNAAMVTLSSIAAMRTKDGEVVSDKDIETAFEIGTRFARAESLRSQGELRTRLEDMLALDSESN